MSLLHFLVCVALPFTAFLTAFPCAFSLPFPTALPSLPSPQDESDDGLLIRWLEGGGAEVLVEVAGHGAFEGLADHQAEVSRRPTAAIPMENPYCSCKLTLTAAIHMENPYCSCKHMAEVNHSLQLRSLWRIPTAAVLRADTCSAARALQDGVAAEELIAAARQAVADPDALPGVR